MNWPSKKLSDEIAIAIHDVNHHWEQYAGEAILICRKLTDRLSGRIVRFKTLGRPEMRGVIEQVTDQLGSIMVCVKTLPKSGTESCFQEIYLSDIKSFESKGEEPK